MRRRVLATVAVCAALQVPVPGSGFQVAVPGSPRSIVSRADRVYTTPVARSENGIPIGNGRVGAVIWTTPRALKFQMNRVDIQVDLELAGAGADVFTIDGTHQRLSVYEGLVDVKAAGVNARLVAWPERDVIAIEVEDRRPTPEPLQINLRTRHLGTVRPRDRVAESRMTAHGGRILLTQNLQEAAHRETSAVAIALLGRKTLTRLADETEARIVSPGERGRVVILIASATTVDAGQDVAAAALANLDAAAAKSFDDLAGDTAEWWYDFWQRNAMASHSDNYHYSLYLIRATKRNTR